MKLNPILSQIHIICLTLIVASCGVSNQARLQQLPVVLPQESYPETTWLSTMAQTLDSSKNAVYASLPLLWPFLQEKLGQNLRADTHAHGVRLLADAYIDRSSVEENQFQAVLHRRADTVDVTATLETSVRFEPFFEHMASGLKFDGVPVHAFGMSENSFDRVHQQIEIHRYRDDDHFVIGLLSTDRKQQVLLYKTDKRFNTLTAMYEDLKAEIQHGRADMTVSDRLWRYRWTPHDRVVIPRIAVGVEAIYPNLSGSVLHADHTELVLNSVKQSLAFLLNETGTKLAVVTNGMVDMDAPPRGAPEPKNMVLDTPFYVVVKKRGENISPYFVMMINNTELLDMD